MWVHFTNRWFLSQLRGRITLLRTLYNLKHTLKNYANFHWVFSHYFILLWVTKGTKSRITSIETPTGFCCLCFLLQYSINISNIVCFLFYIIRQLKVYFLLLKFSTLSTHIFICLFFTVLALSGIYKLISHPSFCLFVWLVCCFVVAIFFRVFMRQGFSAEQPCCPKTHSIDSVDLKLIQIHLLLPPIFWN